MPPIALTDAQLTAVFDAATPLSLASRDAFLLDLAAALQGQENLGDGTLFRLLRELQGKHLDAPQFYARSEPHSRAWAKAR
jgi:hypothetical protein